MNNAKSPRLVSREACYDGKTNGNASQEGGERKARFAYPHVNGWNVIGTTLKERHLRQKDLAGCLAVSAAAVSQMKSGRIKLNRRQIAAVCVFLRLSDAETRRLYAEIFDARLRCEPVGPDL